MFTFRTIPINSSRSLAHFSCSLPVKGRIGTQCSTHWPVSQSLFFSTAFRWPDREEAPQFTYADYYSTYFSLIGQRFSPSNYWSLFWPQNYHSQLTLIAHYHCVIEWNHSREHQITNVRVFETIRTLVHFGGSLRFLHTQLTQTHTQTYGQETGNMKKWEYIENEKLFFLRRFTVELLENRIFCWTQNAGKVVPVEH